MKLREVGAYSGSEAKEAERALRLRLQHAPPVQMHHAKVELRVTVLATRGSCQQLQGTLVVALHPVPHHVHVAQPQEARCARLGTIPYLH